jgi:hypothetical protein
MLDPSVLVREAGVLWLESLSPAMRRNLLVPRTFFLGAQDGPGGWVVDYYRLSPDFTQRLIRALDTVHFHSDSSESTPLAAADAAADVARALAGADLNPGMAGTLVEEWLFLTEHSTILSRIKAPFVAFKKAGASSVEVAARATLDLGANIELTPRDYRKAGIKWIAVGGSPLLALLGPWGIPPAMLASWFLLVDP